MQIRDIMTRNPDVCVPDTNLREIARMMADDDVGAIPVVESRDSMKPVGIITDRDITCRIVAKGLDAHEKTARDAMTPNLITVRPEDDLGECLRKMEDKKIRRVLVTDSGGRCIGIVSQADVAQRARPDDLAELLRDISQPTMSASETQTQGQAGVYH